MLPVRSPLPSVSVPDPEPVMRTFAEANAHPSRSALPEPLICSVRGPAAHRTLLAASRRRSR